MTAVSTGAGARTTARTAANALAGTGELVRLWLRRDRIMLPIWVYLLTAYVASTVYSFKGLYGTAGSRRDFAAGINGNPAAEAMYGPVLTPVSVASLSAWRVGVTGAVMVAVMNVLLVVRHTRAEEESGRSELLGATVVGRHAPLTAALTVAATADLLLALLAAGTLLAFGMPAAGAVAFGLVWAATGLVFAGVAAVTAQLFESSRLANGAALAMLGAFYLVRAAGDIGSSALTWLSPIGWTELVRPYAGDRWAVLLLPVALTAALAAAAYTLTGHRDFGAGLLPARPGPPVAARSLRSPLALAWRLQRGTLLAWSAGMAVYGLVLGGVADGIGDLVKNSSSTRRAITELGGQQSLVDAYLAAVFGMVGLITAGYAVQSVLRLRGEETQQRLEPLLATPVSRTRWALSHLTVTAAGTVVVLGLTGLAAGLTHGARTGDLGGQVPRQIGAALVQVPGVWLVAAVAVALFGLVPRAAAAAWGVLAGSVLLGQLGPLLKLPQPVMDLAPFSHLPKLPGGAFTATPLIWLTALAAGIGAMGLAGFRRRDLG